jgi:hypothetical protein
MKINIIDWIKVGFVLGLFQGYSIMGYAQNTELYKEKYRPQYHFSPRKGWISDPSGFIYYQNKYHMYWWGKAESEDLVHYKQIIPNNDSVFSWAEMVLWPIFFFIQFSILRIAHYAIPLK